jgi:hypothetical protein
MLLAARACRVRGCCSRSWVLAEGQQANLPSVALTNINRCPVAPDEDDANLVLKSTRPFSFRPNCVVDCSQRIVARVAKDGRRRPLERVCIPFLDGRPIAKNPVRCYQKRVLREERSQRGGISVDECVIPLLSKLTELSKCLGIPVDVTLPSNL